MFFGLFPGASNVKQPNKFIALDISAIVFSVLR